MFLEERKHLLPVIEKIHINLTSSLTSSVRKDNTVIYKGNRYSVPLGTFKGPETLVKLKPLASGILQIVDIETGEIIATHTISHKKGKLVKNNNHRRDRSRKIGSLMEEVKELLDHPDAGAFLDSIRELKPRYIRDQLQLIKENVTNKSSSVTHQTLEYCLKNKLFSAVDFCYAIKHFEQLNGHRTPDKPLNTEIQPLIA